MHWIQGLLFCNKYHRSNDYHSREEVVAAIYNLKGIIPTPYLRKEYMKEI